MKINGKIIVPILALCFVLGAGSATAQKASSDKPSNEVKPVPSVPSSPAYAEIVLKRTELTAELESLVLEYTEEYPKVREIRHVLTLIDRESARLSKVKPTDSSRLTLALGKLIVRKIELETDMWNLLKTYKDEHPDVRRAKRKVQIYENAIGELLN